MGRSDDLAAAGDLWRCYCRNPGCDWEITVSEDDSDFPSSYAKGREMLHGSQRGHPTNMEYIGLGDVERPIDGGMNLCGELESEEELQIWLEEFFEEQGWTAIREVSPHGSDVRADLIVSHDEYGWFGIETKYMRRDGGGKIATAHHQITQKYRGRKYLGERIDLWAICPYFWGINSSDYTEKHLQQASRATFTREFFCRHGIGYLDLDRHQLVFDFIYSRPWGKVPVGGEYLDDYVDDVEVDKIVESVNRKMEKYEYRDR